MSIAMWFTAGTSMVSAVIGASAAIAAVVFQMRHQVRQATRQSEQEAVEQLIARATAVVLRAQQSSIVAPAIGSLSGSVGRLFRIMAPVDLARFSEPLVAEAIGLEHAAARVRLLSDAATRTAAEQLVSAAMDVVTAYNSKSGNRTRRYLRLILLGKRPANVDEIARATGELARQRHEFERHVRER
ncbi:hypothetical protein RDV89_17555 [Nocardioides zeae]|uniref:Uncharacterized protein n=1 Tax=Nocardioides imazamoxiresistens TaxID=3231893 RepID=A0ABU3Q0I4_9ACTN|nr:hypothetical protein [Nocardioides zeae]MDT9594899.1 hypothetical protein [Nocardioides zeae]